MGNQKKIRRKRKERINAILVVSVLVIVLVGSGNLFLWQVRQAHRLNRVEASSVCMLDDRTADSHNYASVIDGRTYYCCQENCGEHFKEAGQSRFAIDPISHATVDKASAIYGRSREGRVYYFENEEDLEAYPP